jgi:hypothetical protein
MAMRPEIFDLIESVRALGIELTDAPAPKCLKITGDPNAFWAGLVTVQRSLEAVDRSGGTSTDIDTPEPSLDSDKLRRALDGVLRLYELQGGNMDQAVNVVEEALAVTSEAKTEKKGKQYAALPVFAPNGIKKKSSYSPRIRLIPEMPGSVSMAGLRSMNFDISYVEAISGATLASDERKPGAAPGLSSRVAF